MRGKNIIIVSSGTGGHIYPGLALAEEFKNKGHNIIFFINNNSISVKILKNSEFKYIQFNIFKMPRKNPFLFVLFLFKMKFIFFKSIMQIIKIKPLVVIGTGGCITIPVLFASKILHKKIFIHEQNSIPGKANLLLNRIADETFISFRISKKYFKNKNTTFMIYPVRKDILLASREKALQKFKLNDRTTTILIFGGSLGAAKLNHIAYETFLNLSYKNKFQILHITGDDDYIIVKKNIKDSRNYLVFKYMHDISNAYAVSDIVICRSGASTIFELKALNKPAILIPYPYATDNHQYHNAREIEKYGRIMIIEEKNLTKEILIRNVCMLKKTIRNNNIDNVIF
ncbi:MAG: UDP-N-acetylglucosamine--N-acetylmuramyl-(pentapeptide) pyrophosphoryl-undecaprenol N-acetylglucosamine transferase [Endomicrobium sp.]|jgi:UDP-N-acetylglucosamine--N-acetylmuramyl-(pentapeptide) pyrophosphoryl-undecaprenol N-acetylglucosamine transferase|nr:UDP-N-acetylglucosamine--N-acetylmuramyl-(pentapeptide) pyrophosphoryl-undecaprenol N-acetylglucosamine transferase [Endomicrobium sp.]